jgi:hypothetical protein
MPSKTLPKTQKTLPLDFKGTTKFDALVKMATAYAKGFIGMHPEYVHAEIKGMTVKLFFDDEYNSEQFYITAKMKYDGVLTLEKMFFE